MPLEDINIAIELCISAVKTQIYNGGNKRTALIYANHYLILKGQGLIAIDYSKVNEFKKYLIDYYENKDVITIKKFLKKMLD